MVPKYTYLEGGQYTEITNLVRTISDRLKKQRGRMPWDVVSEHVKGLRHDASEKDKLFRKRTASEILKSGFTTGCTDRAIVFLALARALGTPARYVETFEKQWLDNPNFNNIQGHVFVDIYDGQGRRGYEPTQGFVDVKNYKLNGKTHVPVADGLDFGELYVLERGIYKPRPVRLQTIAEIKKFARGFTARVN
jgi:hypothetical protein